MLNNKEHNGQGGMSYVHPNGTSVTFMRGIPEYHGLVIRADNTKTIGYSLNDIQKRKLFLENSFGIRSNYSS